MEVDQILGKLVSIKSSFGNEKAIGAYLESYLKEMGFKTKRQYFEKERFNVFAERGLGSKSMLLYGHFDTVPQYGDWQTNPYRLTRKSDRLYGLGAFDMKGGIAAMLKGLEQESNMKIKVLLCGDEENISKGAWHAVIKSRRWFDDVQFAIAGEAGVTHENDGGIGIVTLGRRGRCVITIDVEGISSHGAEPERGLSALDQAAKIATTANEIMTRTSNKLGSESIFINEIHSSSTSLSVPDRAYLNIDIHLVPPSTPEEATLRIEKHVKSLIKRGILDRRIKFRVHIQKRDTPYLNPYVVSEKNHYAKKIIGLAAKRAGRKISISYGQSVADENVLANALKVPVITVGPQGGNEHSANEWVSKSSLIEIAELFGDVVKSV